MSYLSERVSYLKGMSDGLGISEQTGEGKLLKAILEVLEEFADEVEMLETTQDEITETLADILDEDEYDDDDDEELDHFEVECDSCGNKVIIDDEMLDSDQDIKCPNCGEIIEIEFDCECEDDDCDCHK